MSATAVTPGGYTFEHVARRNRRGGGVGVLFRATYTVDHSKLWPASSFECLDLQLRSPRVSSTLRLFVIYRPPSSSRNSQPFATFLTEFRELVECVGTKSGIIIVGDFKVRYGDDSDPHARALRDVLSDANLRQNVTDATHNRGNVLDLVITASSSSLVTGVPVDNLVTDHFAVICDLATTKPRPPRKTIVDVRRLTTPASRQISVSVMSSPILSVMCAAFMISIVPSCRALSITMHHLCSVR